MKGLACPCPALPNFWKLGPYLMAESSRTQAPGQGPPVNIQLLRAQYEGLRRQQRIHAHLMVLPKEGTVPTPAESMTSAIWINKERRSSQLLDETDSEVEGMPEEAVRSFHQACESPWHTYLEMHRLVQNSHQETSHQGKPKGRLEESEARLSLEGTPNTLENDQKAQQGANIPEAAQCQSRVGSTPTKAAGPSLQTNGIWCLPAKNTHTGLENQLTIHFHRRKLPGSPKLPGT